MEIIGKVINCGTIKKGVSAKSGKEWQSYEFVIETEGQYPAHGVFKVFGQENVEKFGPLCNPESGKTYKVSFDIDANEYQGRYYNTLKVWKMEEYTGENTAPEPNVPSKASVTDFAPPAKNNGNNQSIQGQGNNSGSGEVEEADSLPF